MIRRLHAKINMPIRQIVSEIIIRADRMDLITVDLIDDDR